MKRILTLAVALIATAGFVTPANAQSRVIIYPGQRPLSSQANQQPRYTRLALGTWIRNALGSQIGSGLFSGLSVVPNGGMNVAVQPATTNNPGAIYQLCADDTNPVPQNASPQLSADATVIVCQGQVAVSSGSVGPMTAPSTGLSQYYLLETQLVSSDTNSQSLTFVNSNGSTSTSTLNTQRVDAPSYQLKAGTASSSPVIPTADTGWMGVATVLVPSGTATITSGMIAMLPSFAGFIANGANVSVSNLTISSQGAGCLQTNASGVVSAQTCTSGLGAVVSGDSKLVFNTSSGTATGTCPTCVTGVSGGTGTTSTGGSTPSVALAHGDYIDQGSTAQTRTGALTTGAFTSTGNITAGTASGTQVAFGPQAQIVSNGSTATNNVLNVGFAASNSGTMNWYPSGLSNAAGMSLSASGLTLATPLAVAQGGTGTGSASGVTSGSTSAFTVSGSFPSQTLTLAHGTDVVDTTTAQTVGGVKTFSSPPVFSGASITAATVPQSALAAFSGVNVGGALTGATTGAFSGALTVGGNVTVGPSGTGIVYGEAMIANGSDTVYLENGASGALATVTNAKQVVAAGGFVSGSSNYLPTSATVNGNVVASAANALPAFSDNGTVATNVGTGYKSAFGTLNTATSVLAFGTTANATHPGVAGSLGGSAAGVTGNLWDVGISGVSDAWTLDGSGNMGAAASVRAGTFSSSGPLGSYTPTSGDTIASRSGTQGQFVFAQGAASLDYGISNTGATTSSAALWAPSFNVSSRREWKKNVSALSPQDALNIALATPIVRYQYNGKGGHPNESGPFKHTGIIVNNASDVISSHDANGKRVGEDVGALGAVAIAAIQRQQQILDALAYDNRVLRDRIAGLELRSAVMRIVNPGYHPLAFTKGHCPRGTVTKRDKHGRIVGCISRYEEAKR